MRISWNEVSAYFPKSLPPPEETAAAELNGKFCEVESLEQSGDDWILDVKILPDRSDAKTAEGFARELAAVMNWEMKSGVAVLADGKSARAVIEFSSEKLNDILGLSLSDKELISFLNRVRIGIAEDSPILRAFVPSNRADLNIIEDLADEVGRLYGIDRIPPVPLPLASGAGLSPLTAGSSSPLYQAADKARILLAGAGFTEIYGYSFSATGQREVEKSLASHKSFLRTNLVDNIKEKLAFNLQFNLLENKPVKLFEIGTVFLENREEIHIAAGIAYAKVKYKKEKLPAWLSEVKLPTGEGSLTSETSEIIEVPLETLLPALEKIENPDPEPFIHLDQVFKPFSPYPRIIRDIALFVPASISAQEVAEVIRMSAGPLLAEGPVKFDEFKKEGESRISLAFRMAFQAHEKSLTDEEANQALSGIISALEKHPSWEVRK